jgi:hypothetical protein
VKFDFERPASFLRRRADDPDVKALIGRGSDQIESFSYQGYVEFKNEGVSVMFKEAPWVLPTVEIED